ncbi:MAG: queuosine precursor transporter [Bacteroidetes bacterium]|nr:queuosine precursor transporter [Bacteroidota bacterium]
MFKGSDDIYSRRREFVFLILTGFFLGSLTMLNILGLTKLIDLSFTIFNFKVPFFVFIGVLPYPITFLCTDFISELYGKRRANTVVWVGLFLNIWVIFILWIGGFLPPQSTIVPSTGLPPLSDHNRVFYEIQRLTFGAVGASMVAYLTAQFVDVQIFHMLRRLTKGKKLWLRNNGSTLTSQMVDSLAVILITYYYAKAIHIPEGQTVFHHLRILILSNYIYKMVTALIDTIPFYIGVKLLSKYLNIDTTYHETQSKY